MKRVVLGTAGHIDHGKTLLTKALTGIDTDRLAEEKARGITIELGFAAMRLSDGTQVSLIDVPGHERFVRTMMSGVSGIDGVLFVVAADDGVMPQTREHFDILKLLRLRRGIVVLNKCDLVDEARVDEVRAQLRALVRGSFLENAPVCPVSAATGAGLDALRLEIEALVAELGERSCDRPFRMSIDRCFPVAGFGSIAAGTLTEGAVRIGDAIEILPGGARGSIRTLQTHNRNETQALAGMRVAMSFTALEKGAPERGRVVAEPGSVAVTDTLTVRLEVLPDCPYVLRNASQLHFFHGTSEQVCKLRLLGADALGAGASGYAQLQLSAPAAVRLGDRFLLRFFSPVVTVGGGTILACKDGRLRRNRPAVIERLDRLASPRLETRLAARIEDAGLVPVEPDRLRQIGNLAEGEYRDAVRILTESGDVLALPTGLISAAVARARRDAVLTQVDRFHETYPLQPGMRMVEWRGRLFPEGGVPVDALLSSPLFAESLTYEGGYLARRGFVPVFTQEHKIMQRRLLHHYREAWFHAPNLRDVREKFARFGTLFEQMLDNMRIGGMLIPLDKRHWVHFEAYREALDIFARLSADGKAVTLAELRTEAGISRKYSQLFLECWDKKGLTRRVGDAHVAVPGAIERALEK